MDDRDEADPVLIRLSPREARVSRIANFVLGLLILSWRWKPEGEPLPDGGRLLRVPRDVVRMGRFIWIFLFAALAIGVFLIWKYADPLPR